MLEIAEILLDLPREKTREVDMLRGAAGGFQCDPGHLSGVQDDARPLG